MHACSAQLDQHQTCKPVTVSVVSSYPAVGNFNFVQKWQKCQICVIYEKLEYTWFRQTKYLNYIYSY